MAEKKTNSILADAACKSMKAALLPGKNLPQAPVITTKKQKWSKTIEAERKDEVQNQFPSK